MQELPIPQLPQLKLMTSIDLPVLNSVQKTKTKHNKVIQTCLSAQKGKAENTITTEYELL